MAVPIPVPPEELKQLYLEEKKNLYEIAAIFGCARTTIKNKLVALGIDIRPSSKCPVKAGQVYDFLTVLEVFPKKVGGKSIAHAKCQCVCGKVVVRRATPLTHSGHRHSCGCGQLALDERGECGILWYFWRRVLWGAEKRDIPLQVSREEAWGVYQKQGGLCALSGIPLVLPRHTRDVRNLVHTASLDRIDSKEGYVPGNIQWVHKDLNRCKWAFSQEEFIRWCEKITNYQAGVAEQTPGFDPLQKICPGYWVVNSSLN